MTRKLTRPAFIALICVAIWAFGLLYMLFDFYVLRGVWTITPGPILLVLAMAIAVPVLLGSCVALLGRRRQGMPFFMEDAPTEPRAVREDDPLAVQFRNPPDGAHVTSHNGRRVVILTDGSVIGEMLTGRAQRFPSLNEFRSFIGA